MALERSKPAPARRTALRSGAIAAAMLFGAAAPALCAEGGAAAGHRPWLLFVFYVINFAIFCAILWYVDRYFGGFTGTFFRNRNRAIRQTIAHADASLKEGEELARRAAAKLARLEEEKRELAAGIAGETAFAVGRIGELARESAERVRRDGAASAAALSEAARRRMRERMGESAVKIAREIIERGFSDADQGRLLGEFAAKLHEDAR